MWQLNVTCDIRPEKKYFTINDITRITGNICIHSYLYIFTKIILYCIVGKDISFFHPHKVPDWV